MRDNIEKILRRRRHSFKALEENIDDEASKIKTGHFKESMKFAHRSSVSDTDIHKLGICSKRCNNLKDLILNSDSLRSVLGLIVLTLL